MNAEPLPWKKSERDRMLDLFWAGMPEVWIAEKIGKPEEEVHARMVAFFYNEGDYATKYTPYLRISRRGKRITANERLLLAGHTSKKIPVTVTACLLQRDEKELCQVMPEIGLVKRMSMLAPSVDLVLALRYCYHVFKVSVVSDSEYDDLIKEETEFGGGAIVLEGRGNPRAVPPRIISLALYLFERHKEQTAGDVIK